MEDALIDWTRARLAALAAGSSSPGDDHTGDGQGPEALPAPAWQPLRVEASHRRFYRVLCPETGASYVVMSSPPQRENNDQFLALARLFADHGVGVPRVCAADRRRGWFLLSDLGQRHFADAYAEGETATARALDGGIETLLRIQQIDDPAIPPYTRERFGQELDIYRDWFLGELLQVTPSPGLEAAFERLLESTDAQPRCCVHRDYHCRNLLLDPWGAVGVVDFQDALMGPATYDLASLLRDCYHCFPEAAVARWRDAWLARTPLPVDRARFPQDLDFVALQRQIKAVGIFCRLHLRDGRDTHLPHVLPVLRRIAALAARYRALAPLAEHVRTVLPAAAARLEDAP